jgi:hypothetical protein
MGAYFWSSKAETIGGNTALSQPVDDTSESEAA